MIHPTNPLAVRAKREGGKGWHWVYPFDPARHELFEPHPLDHDGDGRKGGVAKPRGKAAK